jgi:hypothetical protein
MRCGGFLGLLGLWLVACGGGGSTPVEGGETPTPEQRVDWTAPAFETGAGGLDATAAYSGGSMRLCVGEAEVRLWALDGEGTPDTGFHKSDADVVFLPSGGEEQMVNGILLKGSAEEGYATRLVGHGGVGVASAHVILGDEQVSFR